MKRVLIFLSVFYLYLPACKSTVDDVESDETESNIETTEEDGVVTGEVDPKIKALIASSKKSKVAGSYVEISPGTLEVDTDVSVGEGEDASEEMLEALGVDSSKNKVVKSTNPLFVGTDEDTEADEPLKIAIPLPIDDDSFDLSTADSGKLVMLYLIYTKTGYRAGIKVLGDSDFLGTYVKTAMDGFGIYIVAYFAGKVTEKEVTVDFAPSLKS